MTTIRYFIPEDGDTEAHPNVFLAPKSRHSGSPPTLGEVKDAFPLPGKYHFRFKSPLVPGGDREKGGMAVWMDCTHDSEPVCVWKQSIVAKVTRLSIEDDFEDDDDDEFHNRVPHNPTTAAATPVQQTTTAAPPVQPTPSHQQTSSANAEPLLDVFDDPTPTPATHSRHASNSSTGTGNLLDVPSAPTSGGSLLDMDAPAAAAGYKNNANSAHNDFLGMTAPAANATPHHRNSSHKQPPAPVQQQQQQPPYGQPGTTPVHGHAASQNGYRPQPTPQQQQRQQQQQQQQARPNGSGAFDSFSQQHNQGPFGGLGTPWK